MKTYKTSVLVSMMLGIFSTTAFSATVPAGTTLSETQIFRQNTHSDPGHLILNWCKKIQLHKLRLIYLKD